MIILKEEVLVRTVSGKRNAGDTEAGEEALETVESAEGTGVSPDFTAGMLDQGFSRKYGDRLEESEDILASPGVSLCVGGSGGRGRFEFVDVEAGGVTSRHGGGGVGVCQRVRDRQI